MSNLMSRTQLTSPQLNCFVYVVDVNDTTDNPLGSDKRVRLDHLVVDWSKVQNKPSSFPSSWNDVGSKPSAFNSDWSLIANIPSDIAHQDDVNQFTQKNFNVFIPGNPIVQFANASGAIEYSLRSSRLVRFLPSGALTISHDEQGVEGHPYHLMIQDNGFAIVFQLNKFMWPNNTAPTIPTTNSGNYTLITFTYSEILQRLVYVTHVDDLVL